MKAPTAPRRRPDEETLTWLNQSISKFYPKHREILVIVDLIFKVSINGYHKFRDVLSSLKLKS